MSQHRSNFRPHRGGRGRHRRGPASRVRGSTLPWITVVLAVGLAFASLAVDWAHVLVVRTELRRTVDAAARYAAPVFDQGIVAVRARAKDAADDNLADGTPVVLSNSD